jgi:hypothetical protein
MDGTHHGDGHGAPDVVSGAPLSSHRFRASCARSLTRPDAMVRADHATNEPMESAGVLGVHSAEFEGLHDAVDRHHVRCGAVADPA